MAHIRKGLGNQAVSRQDHSAAGLSRSSRVVLILLIVVLLSGASIAHLKLTSQATSISYHIRELEERKLQLQSEKGQILFEIAQATRRESLKQRAVDLGLGPTANIEYLPVSTRAGAPPIVVASDRTTDDRADRSPAWETHEEHERKTAPGWWERLLDQFAAWTMVEPEVTPTGELETKNEK